MKNSYDHDFEPAGTVQAIEQDLAGRGGLHRLPRLAAIPRGGWILYDGDCRHCTGAANRFHHIFARRGFQFIPLQTPWVQRRLKLVPGAPLEEMRVVTEAGGDFGGADAVLFLARQVWWLRPLSLLGRLPRMHRALDHGYRWIAAHRGCGDRQAYSTAPSTTHARRISRFAFHGLSAIILLILVLTIRNRVQPWVFMWITAGAIFLGCKWLTLFRAKQRKIRAGIAKEFAYLFLWAGMDAQSFLGPRVPAEQTQRAFLRILFALAKIGFGGLLLFGLARQAHHSLLAGWIGMIGTIFILHFGLFDLAAVCWRMAGVAARPIMNAPFQSTSLAEFWGRRWNGAFNQLILEIFFRPFARSLGTTRATLTAFLISGVIHELVISLPAGAGYGLPAGYFLLQGWGVIAQRTPLRGRVRRNGAAGRVFTLILVGAPAFWLFHPPFVTRVILPFMQAIGAL